MSDTIYYGLTKSGHRLHFGSDVLYPEPGNLVRWVVIAHCGSRVTSHDPDRPAPARVTEFCRNCFRAEAWTVYEKAMLKEAQVA